MILLAKWIVVLIACLICLLIQSVDSTSAMAIEGRIEIPNEIAANIIVTLNGAEFETISRLDGSFKFRNIPSGIYSVDVLAVNYTFSQLKIRVNAEENSVNVVEYKYPGSKKIVAQYPLVLKSLYRVNYIQERPPFSIFRLIAGNPMIAMMIVMGGVLLIFPNLLKMDPELEEEMKKLQEKEGDPLAAFKNLAGIGGNAKNNGDEDNEEDAN